MRFIPAVTSALIISLGTFFASTTVTSVSAKSSLGKPSRVKVTAVTNSSVTLRWRASKSSWARKYAVMHGSKKLKSTKRPKAKVKKLRCGRHYRLRVAAIGPKNRVVGRSKAVTGSTSSCVKASAASFDLAALSGLLAQDMTLLSETRPHGLTTDFAAKPRLSAGANATGYTAFTGWGQLYECASGNPQPSAQVEITGMESWIKSRASGLWSRVQASNTTGGGAYVENYVNDVSKPADAVSSGGTTRARAGGGYNYHFWPLGTRASINPADVSGVITNVRARLAPGSYSNAAAPCYVLSAGADYWRSPGAAWDQLKTNTDVGIGRFKRVDANWRVFTMSTTAAGNLPKIAAGTSELR